MSLCASTEKSFSVGVRGGNRGEGVVTGERRVGKGKRNNLAVCVLTWFMCTVCQNGLTHVSMKSSC